MDAFYKGDSIELEFILFKDKSSGEYWDLTGWEIVFVLLSSPVIKKTTSGINGGSEEQIKILNAEQGTFLVSILSTETIGLTAQDYPFGIQIRNISENKKMIVVKDFLRINDSGITFD